ncbi:hypothetical protein F5B17DRAFT_315372 [Nemania serpens]|nr:hypothetical protein F5B17DRAFT_315372 [Nemania serpens]
MNQTRDVVDVSETGYTTIVASMVVFVILTIVTWALIGFQIYYTHKQRLADLESGVHVRGGGLVDEKLPLDDILKSTTKHANVPSTQARKAKTRASLDTQFIRSSSPFDSRWYAEEQPVRSAFHRISTVLNKQETPPNANVAGP